MEDYSTAGVSLDRASAAKALIAKAAKSTHTSAVPKGIGHFGGFYSLGDGPDSQVLVASTDGVGTKVLLGIALGKIDGLGRDLVQHSVNDILVCGAKPLFFLDYMAFGKLEPEIAGRLAESMAAGCRENGVALIGGETAEMPGLYSEGHFDLAGTIVGTVIRRDILDGSKVKEGDVLLGLASSGPHTNGYSLIRRIFNAAIESGEINTIRLRDGRSLADALLEPHRSYMKTMLPLLDSGKISAMSHITGGGLIENTMRVIPKGLRLEVNWESWPRPELFRKIQEQGQVPEESMRETFNCGIGLVVIANPAVADELEITLSRTETTYRIGSVVS